MTRTTLKTRRRMVQDVVRALRDGTESVLAHPGPAIREIARAGGADEELVRAELDAVGPVLSPRLSLNAERSSAGRTSICVSGSSSTASTCSALSLSI
jgi:hypothetical protein